jgi:hypothetical protein
LFSLPLSHVSDAWALLKKGHTGSNDMVRYFLHGCERLGLCVAASDCMEAIWKVNLFVKLSQDM